MRMRSYTLHVPEGARPGEMVDLDRAVLVPDGFVWPAFAFTPLWFLYHRLWLAALIVFVGLVVLAAIGTALGLSTIAGAVVALLAAWLVGLEASSLRRWTLARRGRPARDAVVTATHEQAEARALERWLGAGSGPAPQPPFPGGPTLRAEPVIGLFPGREGGR